MKIYEDIKKFYDRRKNPARTSYWAIGATLVGLSGIMGTEAGTGLYISPNIQVDTKKTVAQRAETPDTAKKSLEEIKKTTWYENLKDKNIL